MNRYAHNFVVECPNNGRRIMYWLTIDALRTIMVEAIVSACAKHQTEFHEVIADKLFEEFGGFQILKAHHHGVQITTERGVKRDDARRAFCVQGRDCLPM